MQLRKVSIIVDISIVIFVNFSVKISIVSSIVIIFNFTVKNNIVIKTTILHIIFTDSFTFFKIFIILFL